MTVIYCYYPGPQVFTMLARRWAYERTRPFVPAELRASESVWIVPGTIEA